MKILFCPFILLSLFSFFPSFAEEPKMALPVQIKVEASFFEVDVEEVQDVGLFTEILTQSNIYAILDALNNRKSTIVLASPSVVVKSGERAVIKEGIEYIYATEYASEIVTTTNGTKIAQQIAFIPGAFSMRLAGISLDVTPTMQNGGMINLEIEPSVVDAPTWKNFPFSCGEILGKKLDCIMEQPFFPVRSVATSIQVYNGATVLNGGLIAEDQKTKKKRHLLISFKATVVDAWGRVVPQDEVQRLWDEAEEKFVQEVVQKLRAETEGCQNATLNSPPVEGWRDSAGVVASRGQEPPRPSGTPPQEGNGDEKGGVVPFDGGEMLPIPTQIEVEVRFIETDEENVRSIDGKSWDALVTDDTEDFLRMLSSRTNTVLVSAPKLVTISGQQGVVKVCVEYIYPTSYKVIELADGITKLEPDTTVVGRMGLVSGGETMREVGIILDVTPTWHPEDKTIDLDMTASVVDEPTWKDYSVMCMDDRGKRCDIPFQQPFFPVHSVSTKAKMADGCTAVIGSIRKDVKEIRETRTPILGSIPLLGRLFRGEEEITKRRVLLIVATAKKVQR